jgi:glycosyltransferase involved in cell wall biosynthesis
MRILHVAESLPGGIATYLNEAIPYQVTAAGEHNICLIAPDTHLHYLSPRLNCRLVPYRRSGRNLFSLWNLLQAVRRANHQFSPDLIHAHSSFAGGVVRLWSLMQRHRPAVVYCAHGWAFLRESPAWINRVIVLLERLLALGSEKIVSISYYEHDAALRSGLPQDRCTVIRYGLSPPASKSLAPLPQIDDNKLNFFFIGRHDRQKGLDILLKVFHDLPAERFQLYVAGSRVLDTNSSDSATQLPHVHYLGWIAADKVDSYYRLFDAVIMPSRWEGFGLVAVEAMRNAVAVIASNRCALPEVVTDGNSGLIFELDTPQQLRQLLERIDRGLLRRLGENGLRRYLANFTADKMNQETWMLYQQALVARRHGDQPAVSNFERD